MNTCTSHPAPAGLKALLVLAIAGLLGGCTAAPANLELISVARVGLAQAASFQQAQQQALDAGFDAQQQALDAGFDADVRRVAAGELRRPDGSGVELSAEWVISARRGYAAARDALADARRQNQAQAVLAADNLAAADEALHLAAGLILQQHRLSQHLRRALLEPHRSQP